MGTICVSNLAAAFRERYADDFQLNQGASVLLLDGAGLFFSLAKPRNWVREADGVTTVGFSGIGGGLEPNETILECLEREMGEEAGLALHDVVFADVAATQVLRADGVVATLSGVGEVPIRRDVAAPVPGFVLELLLPLRTDRPSGGKERSCLQLFVYLGRLVGKEPRIPPGEDIPALLHVRGECLPRLLAGELWVERGEPSAGLSLLANTHTPVPLPERVRLVPHFTPRVLIALGLGFDELTAAMLGGVRA